MSKLIKSALMAVTLVGLLAGGYVLAAEPTNFDYTGLPVTEFAPDEGITYTTIPTSLAMPECEVVDNQDDYTGVETTRCKIGEEPQLEWDYLY